MKKHFLALFLTLSFVLSPALVSAQNISDLTAQINSLLKTIAALQAQLATLQQNQGQSSSNSTPPSNTPATTSANICFAFRNNLYLGLSDRETGGEVSKLQEFLRSKGDFLYPTNTGFFGPATEDAVKRFQSRLGIVSSGLAETTGHGVIGPQTNRKISELTCKTSISIPVPTFTIDPTSPSLYPEVIGDYKRFGITDKGKGTPECEQISPILGTYCGETYANIEYRKGDSSGEVVFIHFMKITSGKENLQKYLETTASPVIVNGFAVYRIEGHELAWFSNTYDMVMIQEGRFLNHSNGTSFSYEKPATGQNPVSQYFLNKYPPISTAVQSSIVIDKNPVVSGDTLMSTIASAKQFSTMSIKLVCDSGLTAKSNSFENNLKCNDGFTARVEQTVKFQFPIVITNSTSESKAATLFIDLFDSNGVQVNRERITATIKILAGSVQPSITVLSPNGGEVYAAGQDITATISSDTTIAGPVDFYFYNSQGVLMNSLSFHNSYPAGKNSFPINPAKGSSYNTSDFVGQFKLKACTQSPAVTYSVCDSSDNYFTISSSANEFSFTTATPNINSDQSVDFNLKSSVQTVQWNVYLVCPAGIVSKLLLPVYNGIDGCSKSINVAGVNPVFPVKFTNTTNGSQIIYVTAHAYDTSVLPVKSLTTDIPLKIVVAATPQRPSITVLSPNGGESFTKGSKIEVKWNSSNAGSNVGIARCTIGGCSEYAVYPNTGTASVSLGGAGVGQWKISISNINTFGLDTSVIDESDNYFSITEAAPPISITVMDQLSGLTWLGGTQKTIQWIRSNYTGPVGIALQDNSGGWTVVSRTLNTDTYIWTLPHNFAGGEYYLRVSAIDDNNSIVFDSSGNSLTWVSRKFTIAAPMVAVNEVVRTKLTDGVRNSQFLTTAMLNYVPGFDIVAVIGVILGNDVIAMRNFPAVTVEVYESIRTKIPKEVTDRLGAKTGDANFIVWLDVDSDGDIDVNDQSLINAFLSQARIGS